MIDLMSTSPSIPVTEATPLIPPALADRPALSAQEASGLEQLFKVLASDTRLRLLHELARHGERTVTDLAEAMGMSPQAVSNQLQRLADQQVVAGRREGNHIHYRIIDCCVGGVMELGLCLLDQRSS